MRVCDLKLYVWRVCKAPKQQAKLLVMNNHEAALSVGGCGGNMGLRNLNARLRNWPVSACIGDLAGHTGRGGECRRDAPRLRQQTHEGKK